MINLWKQIFSVKTILITFVVVTYCVYKLVSGAINANIQLKNTVNQHETSVSEIMNKLKQANEDALRSRETYEKQIISMKEQLNKYEESTVDMTNKIKKANDDVVKYRESIAKQVALNEKLKVAGEAARAEAQKSIKEARQAAEASVNEGALKVREEFIRQMTSMKAQLDNTVLQYEASSADMTNKLKEANDDASRVREESARQIRKANEDTLKAREELSGQIESLKSRLSEYEASNMNMADQLKRANDNAALAREELARQAKKSGEGVLRVREELAGQIALLKTQLIGYEASSADMANKLKKANEDVNKYREALDKQIALMKVQPVKTIQNEASVADMANKLKKANEDITKYREALQGQLALNEKVRSEADAIRVEAEKAMSKTRSAVPPPVSGDVSKVREELTAQIALMKTHLEKSKTSAADLANRLKKAGDDAAKYREALSRQIVFSEKAKAEADAAKAELEKVISAARSAAPPPVNDDAAKVRKELTSQIVLMKTQLDNTVRQYDAYSAEMTKKLSVASEDALRARSELARVTRKANDDAVKTRDENIGQIASLKTQLRKYESSAIEMSDRFKKTNDELTLHRQALDKQLVLNEEARAKIEAAKVESEKAANQARREAIALVNDNAIKARETLTAEITSLKTQLRKTEISAADTAGKLKQANDDALKARSAFEMQVASMKSQLKNVATQYETSAAEMAAKLKKANDDAVRAREALTKQIQLSEKARAASEVVKIDMVKGIGEAKQAVAAKLMADKARADADALLGQVGMSPDYR